MTALLFYGSDCSSMRRTRVLMSVLAALGVLLVAAGALFWASGAGFKPGAGAA